MAYRILADENVERATVNYLRKLEHDVERLDDIADLGLGAEGDSIARYAREHDRLPANTTVCPRARPSDSHPGRRFLHRTKHRGDGRCPLSAGSDAGNA